MLKFSAQGKVAFSVALLQRKLINLKGPHLNRDSNFSFLLPSLWNRVVLGRTSIGCLKKMDPMIRSSVRSALRLPKDTSRGFFYASVSEGDLGLTCLSTHLPVLRHNRFLRLFSSAEPDIKVAVGSQVAVKRLTGLPFWMFSAGNLIDSREAERNYHTVSLHSAVDEVGLQDCRGVPVCSR